MTPFRTRILSRRWLSVGWVALLIALSPPGHGQTRSWQVTSTADSGPGSLREAIDAANGGGGPHTIHFSPTLADQTITLTSRDYESGAIGGDSAFLIDTVLTIDGSDAPGLVLERGVAGDELRFFRVRRGAVLTLHRMTLQNGLARGRASPSAGGGRGGAEPGMGGAVLNEGTLFLDECTLEDNEAIGGTSGATSGSTDGGNGAGLDGGDGGAFGNPGEDGGDASGPFSGGGGGGNSFTSQAGDGGVGGVGGGGGGGGGESAGSTSTAGSGAAGGFGAGPGKGGGSTYGGKGGPGAGFGGALFTLDGATTVVTNSLLIGNEARRGGDAADGAWGVGGAVFDFHGSTTISNSTVIFNWADDRAAAVFTYGGNLWVESSTITGHSGSSIGREAGGLVEVRNTILAGSCASGTTVASRGFNFEWSGDTCGFDEPTDLTNVTTQQIGFGTFGEHGGPTRSVEILPTSLAVDTGVGNGFCPSRDQRGTPRPADGNANGIFTCDRGAYEQQLEVFADGFESGDAAGWDGP